MEHCTSSSRWLGPKLSEWLIFLMKLIFKTTALCHIKHTPMTEHTSFALLNCFPQILPSLVQHWVLSPGSRVFEPQISPELFLPAWGTSPNKVGAQVLCLKETWEKWFTASTPTVLQGQDKSSYSGDIYVSKGLRVFHIMTNSLQVTRLKQV